MKCQKCKENKIKELIMTEKNDYTTTGLFCFVAVFIYFVILILALILVYFMK